MRFHAGLKPRSFEYQLSKPAADQPGLSEAAAAGWPERAGGGLAGRHLFGPPQPEDLHRGPGTREETEDLLARLAVLMVEIGRGPEGVSENQNIPAGYTYLAQLVGHDVVHHTTPLAAYDVTGPDLSSERRIEPLVLETIYGGGPLASPQVYAVPAERGAPRSRLRLGTIQGAPLVYPYEAPRDIPRIACPHLNDAAYGGHHDVLIGDPRNDDNLILSQLTVVFHLLHNLVVDRLATTKDPEIVKHLQADPYQILLTAQRVVALIYRDIVVADLLERILDGNVLKFYLSLPGRSLEQADGGAREHQAGDTPLEFAFGAYRFGHALVRRSYELNDRIGRTGLTDILEQTSEGRARAMPLTADWLVQWSRFFELGETRPEFSRKLGPSIVAPLSREVEPDRIPRGGLAFEDLRTSVAAGLRSVDSLVREFRQCAADNVFPEHPLYGDRDARAAVIDSWLKERRSQIEERVDLDPELRLDDTHIAALAKDPPLLFFVLLEAELIAKGDRLGPLGSLIIAESLLPLLERKRALIEGDAVVNQMADAVFESKRPRTMPELLYCLADGLDLARPEARFV